MVARRFQAANAVRTRCEGRRGLVGALRVAGSGRKVALTTRRGQAMGPARGSTSVGEVVVGVAERCRPATSCSGARMDGTAEGKEAGTGTEWCVSAVGATGAGE